MHVRQATLETHRYLCKKVSLDAVVQDQVNKILTAIVQAMNASEGNNKAPPTLVLMLLENLLKQEGDQDQDEGSRNLAMAGGTSLGSVTPTVRDDIVPLVMTFVQENLVKDDGRHGDNRS